MHTSTIIIRILRIIQLKFVKDRIIKQVDMNLCNGLCVFMSALSLLRHLLIHTCDASVVNHVQCHHDDSYALLQFKDSFTVDMDASGGPFAYPKTESWERHGQGSNCCSWDGVDCDNVTGHVISLDLSHSCLSGSIHPNTTLFQLVQLRSLNLADNDFHHSPIPLALGHLSRLTLLNLTNSSFSGLIPSSVPQLNKLSLLDLSHNDGLILKEINFERLIQNLTTLETLALKYVNIVSRVPESVSNLTSLKFLGLSYCGLYGVFPIGVFRLTQLKHLRLESNQDLNGHLPEFNASSPLQHLFLGLTLFSGELPPSLGNLVSLRRLVLGPCRFTGRIPHSIQNLTQLVGLSLGGNSFEDEKFSSFSWICKHTDFTFLNLGGISFQEEILPCFANLSHLSVFYLNSCQLRGHIPSWITRLTQIIYLNLANNELQGPIPESIFQLESLQSLMLDGNKLSGTIEFHKFQELEDLTVLYLSGNNFSLVITEETNSNYKKFNELRLGACNLSHIPHFLKYQDELQGLDLSDNKIHGQIPKWLWNSSKDSLRFIDLSFNFLTGFEDNPVLFPWSQIQCVGLKYNMLQGSFPKLPPSVQALRLAGNNVSGEVSQLLCNSSSLRIVDISHNYFSGKLPECIGNSASSSIEYLDLAGNRFFDEIPQTHTKSCSLRILKLNSNKLSGKVPKSLVNCRDLEYLDLGENRINDEFPYWLGALQELQILILRSNQFHGILKGHSDSFWFKKMRIINLSHNYFSGHLPEEYLVRWNGMKVDNGGQLSYMTTAIHVEDTNGAYRSEIVYANFVMAGKGTDVEYNKILDSLIAIDFSSNRFQGIIPDVIGNLKGLRLLNLSNNYFIGHIPSSLVNLSLLESLDLSQNKISGEIPQCLAEVTTLEVFNVSHNNLVGPIPHSNQFDTFDNSSYVGNSGLCGGTLSRKCEHPNGPPQQPYGPEEEDDDALKFGCEPVVIGYTSGVAFGVIIGHIVVTRYYAWLARFFRFPSRSWHRNIRK